MKVSAATAWKLAGAAGLVGVVATGAVIARAERQRQAYSAGEVREQLHARYARATAAGVGSTDSEPPPARRRCLRALWRRR